MTRIPTPALILGLAGLSPFVYGAVNVLVPATATLGRSWSASHSGVALLQIYGIVILCFMAGVIWGFAAKTNGARATLFYALSVLPAIFVFLTAFAAPRTSLTMLIVGFIGLLAVDWLAQKQGVAPRWWLSLRLMLTGVVVLCLGIGFVA